LKGHVRFLCSTDMGPFHDVKRSTVLSKRRSYYLSVFFLRSQGRSNENRVYKVDSIVLQSSHSHASPEKMHVFFCVHISHASSDKQHVFCLHILTHLQTNSTSSVFTFSRISRQAARLLSSLSHASPDKQHVFCLHILTHLQTSSTSSVFTFPRISRQAARFLRVEIQKAVSSQALRSLFSLDPFIREMRLTAFLSTDHGV
jgi:hypothetical protein